MLIHFSMLFAFLLALNLQISLSYYQYGYYISDLDTTDLSGEATSWVFSSGTTKTYTTNSYSGMSPITILGGPNTLAPGGSASGQSISRTYNGIPTPHSFVTFVFRIWYFDNWSQLDGSPYIKWKINGVEQDGPKLTYANDFRSEAGGLSGVKDSGFLRMKGGIAHTSSTLTFEIYSMLTGEGPTVRFGIREIVFIFSDLVNPPLGTCHLSDELGPLYSASLSYNECFCPMNAGRNADSTGCDPCASKCKYCFGGLMERCMQCDDGLAWTKTDCCHPLCKTCTGTTQNNCPECYPEAFNYGNNVCRATCPPAYVSSTVGTQQMCTKRCTSSSPYFYEFNTTCLASCPLPLVSSTDADGIQYCTNPCTSASQYLYPNGSCLACPSPLISRSEPGVQFCWNPCPSPSTDFLYYNGSCLSNCIAPLVSRTEPGVQFCWNPCPSPSTDFLYYNGSCIGTCVSPLMSRTEPGVKYCWNPCPSPTTQFLYYNGSCLLSCVSPLVSRTEPGVKYCWNPCPSPTTQFLYSNGSCIGTCPSPLVSRNEPNVKYCWNPCPDPSTDFLYYNGSCFSSCVSPLVSRNEPGVKYCWNPCPSPMTQFLYYNGSCLASCVAPLVSRTEPDVKYCWNPCPSPSTEFLYPNRSCLSTCPLPMAWRQEPGVKYCWNPCPDPVNDYLFKNQSCFTTCPAPLVERNEPDFRFCENPCQTGDYLYPSSSCSSECPLPLKSRTEPDVQYCFNPCAYPGSYLYPNGTCSANCLAPFVKKSEPDVDYCTLNCVSPNIYWYQNGSCLAKCEFPYNEVLYSGVIQCLSPCDSNSYYYDSEKVCRSTCPSPYQEQRVDSIKICHFAVAIDMPTLEKVKQTSESIQTQKNVASGGIKAAGIVNSRSPGSALVSGLSSMLNYIRYMRINYPPKVQALFFVAVDEPISFSFDFNIPERIEKNLEDYPLPDEFDKYEINSNFVRNLWGFLTSLLLSLGVVAFFGLGSLLSKPWQKPHNVFGKCLQAAKWNIPIMMVCGNSGDIFFYAALHMRVMKLESDSSLLCFAVILLMMFATIWVLIINLSIVWSFKRVRSRSVVYPINAPMEETDLKKKWQDYEVLYADFTERSHVTMAYMSVFIARGLMFNLSIACLFEYPLVQVALMNACNFLMFVYLVAFRPFKDKLSLAQVMINELLIIVLGINLMVLAVLDYKEEVSDDVRYNIGEAILLIIQAFNMIALIFLGIQVILVIIGLWRAIKYFRAKGIKSPLKMLQIIIFDEFDSLENGENSENTETERQLKDGLEPSSSGIEQQENSEKTLFGSHYGAADMTIIPEETSQIQRPPAKSNFEEIIKEVEGLEIKPERENSGIKGRRNREFRFKPMTMATKRIELEGSQEVEWEKRGKNVLGNRMSKFQFDRESSNEGERKNFEEAKEEKIDNILNEKSEKMSSNDQSPIEMKKVEADFDGEMDAWMKKLLDLKSYRRNKTLKQNNK